MVPSLNIVLGPSLLLLSVSILSVLIIDTPSRPGVGVISLFLSVSTLFITARVFIERGHRCMQLQALLLDQTGLEEGGRIQHCHAQVRCCDLRLFWNIGRWLICCRLIFYFHRGWHKIRQRYVLLLGRLLIIFLLYSFLGKYIAVIFYWQGLRCLYRSEWLSRSGLSSLCH